MILKSRREIEIMRVSNTHVAEILELMAEAVAPGVTTKDLDDIAAREIKRRNLTSAFMGYHGFTGHICASVNEEVVHGIPSPERVLEEGDIIGIDFGSVYKGYVGDSARTIPVGKISDTAQRLLDATKESLEAAIQFCTPDYYLSDIGKAIQGLVEPRGFSVVRNFVGHGIGTAMHEDPQVPHFYTGKKGPRLRPGLVIAIEPMINEGTLEVDVLADGWTAVTRDRKLSAHFEHSIAITTDGPYVLSRLD